jgi:hypothetical protein
MCGTFIVALLLFQGPGDMDYESDTQGDYGLPWMDTLDCEPDTQGAQVTVKLHVM